MSEPCFVASLPCLWRCAPLPEAPVRRYVVCSCHAATLMCGGRLFAGLNQALTKRLEMFESAFAKQNATAAAAFFTSYGVFLSADYAPFVGQIGAHNKRVQLRQPVDDWTRVGWYLQVSRTLCKA